MCLPNSKTDEADSALPPTQPFFNRLYVRIWLAVVLSVAVLIFLVGWAWRESAEHKLAELQRVTRGA